MSRPRQVLPNTTYLVTRRCTQRQFLLTPSPVVNNLILYCFAYAAWKYKVTIHALCVMSNHYHLACTDVLGRLPKFMHWVNSMVARALNAYYGRSENFWNSSKYSRVELLELEDVLGKTVYTLANPVAAGLVSEGVRWPGVRIGLKLRGPLRILVKKPKFFFRKGGPLPDTIELVIEPPPGLEEEGEASSQPVLEAAVLEEEAALRARLQDEGRSFLGAEGVLEQSPTDSPKSPPHRTEINPQVACKNKERRIQRLEALKQWLVAYRQALKEFARGIRDVVFPAGTYWMRIHCGVACQEPEPG